jgi:hypothetical protein
MLRRGFIQSILGVIGLAGAAPAAGARVARRFIRMQTSPVAGFQYHNREAVWGWLCPGQALDLVRERDNPYDNKAVRVDWLGHKLGYVPRIENHAVAQLLDRGERLSARIVALEDKRDAQRWEWDWERIRFEIFLET